MPTSLDPRSIRRDTPRAVASVPAVVSRATARAAASARGTASGEVATTARQVAAHTAHTAFIHHCTVCRADRDSATDAAALASLTRRTVKRNDGTARAGDAPRAIGTAVRVVRVDGDNVIVGDTTANGTARKSRATQRYAVDTHTRIVSDTHNTNERAPHNARTRRNSSPLIIRDNKGEIDTQNTMLVVAHYRHALACRNPRNAIEGN